MENCKIEQIEQNENTDLGNTRNQISQSKYWCFTYHKGDYSTFEQELRGLPIDFWIYSQEYGKSGNTPHLQGYIECSKKVRPSEFKLDKKIHWSKRKGTRLQNIVYICKYEIVSELDRDERPFKIDWDKDWDSDQMNYVEKELKDYEHRMFNIPKIKVIDEDRLYDWENEILSILTGKPCDRTIYWYWSARGNVGKSSFTKYLAVKHDALVLSGNASDMKYAVSMYVEKQKEYPKIIILDIARNVNIDKISYTGIEEVKNGCFFSGKYESKMVLGDSPHFICFSNREPMKEKLSEDRWVIECL